MLVLCVVLFEQAADQEGSEGGAAKKKKVVASLSDAAFVHMCFGCWKLDKERCEHSLSMVCVFTTVPRVGGLLTMARYRSCLRDAYSHFLSVAVFANAIVQKKLVRKAPKKASVGSLDVVLAHVMGVLQGQEDVLDVPVLSCDLDSLYRAGRRGAPFRGFAADALLGRCVCVHAT